MAIATVNLTIAFLMNVGGGVVGGRVLKVLGSPLEIERIALRAFYTTLTLTSYSVGGKGLMRAVSSNSSGG